MADEKKYLDKTGLTNLVGKIKSELSKKANTEDVQPKGEYATLVDGTVPASQLPSYVDDVVEFSGFTLGEVSTKAMSSTKTSQDLLCRVQYVAKNNVFVFYDGKDFYGNWGDANTWGTPISGTITGTFTTGGRQPESGKIYVDTTTGKTYRWSGSSLVEISASLALGETSETAFAGDRGVAVEKSLETVKSELSKKANTEDVESLSNGVKVNTASLEAKSVTSISTKMVGDVLNIVATKINGDEATSYVRPATIGTTGLMSAEDKNKLDNTIFEEGKRQTAENSRVEAENSRVTAESGRVTAENARVAAENSRVSAEQTREQSFTAKVGEVDTAIKNCNTATEGAERVDATITEANVLQVTDRNGTQKTLDLAAVAKANSVAENVDRLKTNMFSMSNSDWKLTPLLVNSLFTNKATITNNGVWVNSDIHLTSDLIYIGRKDYIRLSVEFDKTDAEQYNILTFYDKDGKFLSYINNAPSLGIAQAEIQNKNVVYCRITLLKSIINDNLKFKITTKKPYDEEYVLGSLRDRTNLIYSEIIGRSVINGNIESAGQQNKKTCIIPVKAGETYYFYSNSNGKAVPFNTTYTFSTLLFNWQNTLFTSQNGGSGTSATATGTDLYLYVTYGKSQDAMVCSSEQEKFFPQDNDTYIKVGEHDSSITELQSKVGEHDSSITELQSKVGDSGIKLTKHPVAKEMTDDSATIAEATTSSTITGGTYYPILKNNKPHGEVSDLFRFSLPVQPNSGVYPLENGVEQYLSVSQNITTEFYFEGTEFEVCYRGTYSFFTIIADDVIIGRCSNSLSDAFVWQKISFSTSKKRHIKIRGTFYGIITEGIITPYKQNRLLLSTDGDSITEGSSQIYPKNDEYCWAVRVSEILDCDLNNAGVGGSGYVSKGNSGQPNMVDRYDDYIGKLNTDILFVMGGLNDGYNDDWKTAVDTYWEHVHNTFKGKYVIVASPYWSQLSKNDDIKNKTEYLKSVALKYNYPFVDVYNGVTYDAMGQVIATNSNGGLVNTTTYPLLYREYIAGTTTDNTHINNIQGHEYVARYIANEIFRICHEDFGITL